MHYLCRWSERQPPSYSSQLSLVNTPKLCDQIRSRPTVREEYTQSFDVRCEASFAILRTAPRRFETRHAYQRHSSDAPPDVPTEFLRQGILQYRHARTSCHKSCYIRSDRSTRLQGSVLIFGTSDAYPPFCSIACASKDSPLIRYCSPFLFRATQPTSEGARSFGAIYLEQDGLRRLARDRIDRL